jgi:uncharacterized membrane protein YhaH (DUF805 family)|tara:strand:+ start:1447 stop:1809 length:363 start_codon:yes stop_codon:yes gene_type:complete
MNYFIKCFRDYAVFEGRSTRSEYWSFTLIYFLVYILVSQYDIQSNLWNDEYSIGFASFIFSLAALVPSFAVSWRRLHDSGKSGWLTLLWLVPIVGWIWILVLLFKPSDNGENEYGLKPGI